jgi:hypothetical protein
MANQMDTPLIQNLNSYLVVFVDKHLRSCLLKWIGLETVEWIHHGQHQMSMWSHPSKDPVADALYASPRLRA